MAIIYSYPVVDPTLNDLVLGTDVDAQGKPTKNFTIQSIVSLIQGSATGLEAVLADSPDGGGLNILNIGNITGGGVSTSGSFTDGTMTISNGVGTGFVSITSTDFTGNLTGIVKNGSSIEGNVTGTTQPIGTSNAKLATTEFVMNKVDPSVLQYLGDSTGPFDLNLVTDDFKISGTANQIETTATTVGNNVGTINLKFPTTGVTLPNGSIATTQAAADNTTKVATDAFVQQENNAQDLDFTGDTGTSSVLLNSQTLDFEGTTDQITTVVSAQKVKFSLPTDVTIGGIFSGTTFSGDLNGTINTATTGVTQNAGDDSVKIATTEYVDNAAGAKTLSYKDTSATVKTMNLVDDDIQFTGGSNITSTATAVNASNIADIKFDLNNSVTISGTSKADTFTTTAGTATWVTTVLDGFTAITSDLFTGDLTGLASSATALASGGALSFGGEVTLSGSTPSPATYTSGGNITLNLDLNNAAVIGKVLTGLPTPAAATVVASDSILEGIGKLQSQINGIANGLQFQGTWNANIDEGGTGAAPNGTPALTSGGGEASSGTTDATTVNELVDSTKDFSQAPNVVAVGDKVINQADGQEALVNDITNAANGRLGLAADIMLTGEAYIIDKTPFITAGHYYVVNAVGATTAKNATLNGIQDWQIGDWVIASINNVWQKLDNSAVEGSGTQNRLTKWGSATSTIVDSIVLEETGGIKLDSGKTITTQGTGGNLVIAGDATISGLTTAEAALSLTGGVNLPTGAYGAANQVLGNDNAAGASGNDLVWITPTTGTVTEVDSGDGLITNPTAGITTIGSIAIDYEGTDNAILTATTATEPILASDQIWFNDVATLAPATINEIKKAPISSLPFDNFAGWVLSDNEGTPNTTTIVSGGTAKFAGGTYITTGEASGTLTINHDATTRTDTTSTDGPAFAGTFEAVTSVTSNATGHVTAIDVSTVTIPSNPVFIGPADATTDGIVGIVPAPGQGTFNGGYFLRQDATWAIPPNDQGVQTVNTTSPIGGGGSSATVTITHDDSGVTAGTYDSVTVDAKGHVTAGSNPGGSGGGIFSGDQAITTAGGATLAFTLTRATTGTMVFDVWLTSETGTGTSVAKKYVVAHSYNTTPVYNKILDTGPRGSADFTVQFIDSAVGATGTSVKCILTAVNDNQNIGYTVQVGHDSTNALTFTAAS